jgi:hypothetical protein
MSIRIINDVWTYSKASGTDLLVLLALADNANDEGECWPSMATIGRKCRVDTRTARRRIRSLEEIGEVVVILGGGKASSSGGLRSNRYRITVHMADDTGDVSVSDDAGNLPESDGDTGTGVLQTRAQVSEVIRAQVSAEPSFESSENRQSLAPAKADAEERIALRAAVLQACQLDPERITSSAEGALSKATKDISDVGATPEDVVEAANAYRTRFPKAPVTPLALAKHWPTLSGSPSQGQPRITIPWYERIAIVTARSISDPVEARAQIVDELGAEADFIELAMMAWERTRNDAGVAHCGAF